MLNTRVHLLLLTQHLLSPSRDIYSGLTSGLVRYDQGGMRKIPCLGWAKWKLGRAPCPRGTRTWACGRRVSKPPPPPYTQSLQEWRSPPTSTWEFQRWGASWDPCANTQPLCHIVLEDSLVEVAYGNHVPPGEVPPHSSSLDCTKVYSLLQQKKHFMNRIFSFCKHQSMKCINQQEHSHEKKRIITEKTKGLLIVRFFILLLLINLPAKRIFCCHCLSSLYHYLPH